MLTAAAIVAAALSVSQQAQPASAPVIASATAVRAAAPPQIDGRDDHAVWQQAPRYSEFRQFEPKVDVDPSFRAEFRAAYDERNLYVFVRMFDPHPDSIMHALSRRDVRGPSDQIKLLINSYNDRRSGFEFAVNPDGVKRDYSMSNDGNEDESWNGVWDVATNVDSLGWTAEFLIPLSQLRYTGGTTAFGFGIWRDIERYRERSSWPLSHPQRTGLSSQLGRVEGMSGLTTARRVELTPYVVTKSLQRKTSDAQYDRLVDVTGGGDIKIGITPNVTLDATVNPDFGLAALEGIRLDLLRLHAGAGDLAPVTTLMDAARLIGEDLSRLAEAQREVEGATRRRLGAERTPTPRSPADNHSGNGKSNSLPSGSWIWMTS